MIDPVDKNFFKMAIGPDRIQRETSVDITARCPICGDSRYSKRKARLHLYQKNNVTLVNCFNECSVQNLTMNKFLKQFYPNLFQSYKDSKFSSNLSILRKNNSSEKLNNLKSDVNNFMNELKTLANFSENTECHKTFETDLVKPNILFNLETFFIKSPKVYDYLETRNLECDPTLGEFYLGKSINIDSKIYPIDNYIVIPLYCGDKWYGFYSRSLKEHKFFTYMPDKNNGFKLWNFYNLEPNKPVYVFEGIFDAMSARQSGIENVVACMGATPPLDLLKDLQTKHNSEIIFCLDNDRTGFINSIKYAKLNYKTVVWPDGLPKDCNDMLLKNINIKDIILNNTFKGIQAEIKLKRKL